MYQHHKITVYVRGRTDRLSAVLRAATLWRIGGGRGQGWQTTRWSSGGATTRTGQDDVEDGDNGDYPRVIHSIGKFQILFFIMSTHPISTPPPGVSPPASGIVRRHHTITAASRISRAGSRVISEEEEQQAWSHEDEVVDNDWVGGIGAVGEKSAALHRQASLPTRYAVSRGMFPSRAYSMHCCRSSATRIRNPALEATGHPHSPYTEQSVRNRRTRRRGGRLGAGDERSSRR